MGERLTALDATFLELEEADLSAHMHIGAVMIFAPGAAPSVSAVGAELAHRLDALPRYRQHLSQPRTGGLSWPSWENGSLFEIRDHVHRARLLLVAATRVVLANGLGLLGVEAPERM